MRGHRVDEARWARMTLLEQMGNIGSEVGRSIKAKQTSDPQAFENALLRTLNLFDITVAILITHKSIRAKEVLRAKDQYLHLFYGAHDNLADAAKVEAYFMQFALAARLSR